jgi:hypothetical protein
MTVNLLLVSSYLLLHRGIGSKEAWLAEFYFMLIGVDYFQGNSDAGTPE